jgi:TonB family protein
MYEITGIFGEIQGMRLLLAAILSVCPSISFCQLKLYFDVNCRIAMKDIATHYWLANIDTVSKKYIGEIKEFNMNDSLIATFNFEEPYVKNSKEAGACMKTKALFEVSPYIRKKEYQEIYTLISKSKSQHKDTDVFTIVEEPSYFPGGMDALGEFISAYLKYPETAVANETKGKVVVEFTITEDGSLSDFIILQGIGYGCDEEAIRVLKMLPDWVPAYQRGGAVRSKFRLPITFN